MSHLADPPPRLEARRGVFYLLAYAFFSFFSLAAAASQFWPGSSQVPAFPANWIVGVICIGVAGWLAMEAFRMRPRSDPTLVMDEQGLEHIDLGRIEWPEVASVYCAPPVSMLTGSALYVRLKPRDARERIVADFGGKPRCWVIPLRGLDRSESAIGATAREFKRWSEASEPEEKPPMSLDELGELARQTGDPAALAFHERLVAQQHRNEEIFHRVFAEFDLQLARRGRRSRIANRTLGILLLTAFLFGIYMVVLR